MSPRSSPHSRRIGSSSQPLGEQDVLCLRDLHDAPGDVIQSLLTKHLGVLLTRLLRTEAASV